MQLTSNIRHATLDDTQSINELLTKAWFAKRSGEGWKWLFEENPFQEHYPAGFVSCGPDGQITGFVGSCIKQFSRNGQTLKAMTGHSLVAHPEHLTSGFRLMKELVKQDIGFSTYTLNNNEIAAKLYPRIADNIPLFETTANTTLQWITNPILHWEAGLKRRYHVATQFKTARDGRERFSYFKSLNTQNLSLPKHISTIDSHADEADLIDEFWERLCSSDRIYTQRDSRTINWILNNPDIQTPPIFITYDRGNGIEGWLIAIVTKESEIAAPILSIIDLVALPDDEATILPELVNAAMEIATQMKLMKLHLPHVTNKVMQALTPSLKPANIKTNHYAHAHGCFNPPYSASEFEENWYQTPLDGDYSFCLRPMPA